MTICIYENISENQTFIKLTRECEETSVAYADLKNETSNLQKNITKLPLFTQSRESSLLKRNNKIFSSQSIDIDIKETHNTKISPH